ncbi:hypothetical protein OHAE_2804 [Ochrobactrum soli]|uniref:Uncharacterized protein n=1 Tax=Ochrobactrum soli TaxID=2448455 RepID=A0A2P9HFK9_9HYPH|nr:hypothetical protein OHAE_2804 [[Ochrobactrum] soli]
MADYHCAINPNRFQVRFKKKHQTAFASGARPSSDERVFLKILKDIEIYEEVQTLFILRESVA